ncbi:S-DNA-T family DNA segregation ATPase FtsK/SpoIIIE [Elusimicrobium posterum]|uniref:FtsK/SpoIIIE family DNA translocase n=1 Tax=Elusimicrobium posterum TaxID=3116653 RepID=UPI003C712DC7
MRRNTYYLYKGKKKTKKERRSAKPAGQHPMVILFWALAFALCAWLFVIQWFSVSPGPYGETISKTLFNHLGHAAYLLPLFFFYWLVRSIKTKTFNFIVFLIGMAISLSAMASLLTCLRLIFTGSAIFGGKIGQEIFFFFQNLIGAAGAAFLSLAILFTGIHILFAIPWVTTFHYLTDLIKTDYDNWIAARAELKAKVVEAQEEEKKAKPAAASGPVAEPIQDFTQPVPLRSKPEIRRPVAEVIKAPKPYDREEKKAKAEAGAEQNNGEYKKVDMKDFKLPSTDLLNDPKNEGILGPTDDEIAQSTALLENTLRNFDIGATVTGVSPGPVVTRYEIKPDPGVRISNITAISNDIALAMKARGIRVEAPIPGKDAIGFEIPNDNPMMVTIKEILQDPSFVNSKAVMPIALGRYADGLPATTALEKTPHLLIAGATNSGKSICLHTIIMSVLYKAKPDEVKFLMIDPKRLELTLYEGIPHLYDPKTSCDDVNVITDAQGAVKSLQTLVKVMEKRTKIMELAKCKNIAGYNEWAEKNGEEKMFYVVVIIDELADLMLQTRAAIEDSIQRLAQMARAVGIHLVLCTQRPSVNVITGVIKANLPSRIALQVASKTDSRVILDALGADALLGKGDMLFQGTSDQKPNRIQGAYVSETEIAFVADFLRAQGGPDYPVQIVSEQAAGGRPEDGLGTSPEEMEQALSLITERRRVSQDLLKAHFGSSARATNILSILEMKGFITKPEGSNRWEIHFDLIESQLNELRNKTTSDGYETVYK